MFKFFFCALLFSTLPIFSSSLTERDFDSNALFESQQNSPPFSLASTQPPSPVAQERIRLLDGLNDNVTERPMSQTAVVNIPQDYTCQCAVNTDGPYCKATLYFLGYLTVVGGVGTIITAIVQAT
ncbi:MAG: hypothetical protein WC747_03610 [Candidatus Babeliales bacterium]|jgi:hypothetical protein